MKTLIFIKTHEYPKARRTSLYHIGQIITHIFGHLLKVQRYIY